MGSLCHVRSYPARGGARRAPGDWTAATRPKAGGRFSTPSCQQVSTPDKVSVNFSGRSDLSPRHGNIKKLSWSVSKEKEENT